MTDVDTDLYKLIMSPQYLTTEHIQVTRIYSAFRSVERRVAASGVPNLLLCRFYSFCLSLTDISVSITDRFEIYPFLFCHSP